MSDDKNEDLNKINKESVDNVLLDDEELDSFEFDRTDDDETEISEIEDKKTRKNKKKKSGENKKAGIKVLDIVLVFLIVSVVSFVVSYFDGGYGATFVGKIQAIVSVKKNPDINVSTLGENIGDFIGTNSGFAICSDGSLSFGSSSDSKNNVIQISMGSPRIVSRGAYRLLYDLGNNTYSLYRYEKLVQSFTRKETIIGAAVSKNGTHIILSSTDNMDNLLTVYDVDGIEKFQYKIEYGLFTSAVFSDSSKRFAAAATHTENATTKTEIFVFDVDSSKPAHQFSFTDELVLNVRFLSKNKLMIITDKNVYCADGKDNSIIFSGDKKTLKCLSTENDVMCACVYVNANDDNASNLVLFTKRGKQIANIAMNGRVVDVSCSKRGIAVLFDKKIETYSTDADLIGTTVLNKSADNIVQAGSFNFVRSSDSIKKYPAYSSLDAVEEQSNIK